MDAKLHNYYFLARSQQGMSWNDPQRSHPLWFLFRESPKLVHSQHADSESLSRPIAPASFVILNLQRDKRRGNDQMSPFCGNSDDRYVDPEMGSVGLLIRQQ